jgi:hypothetical protein
MMDVAPQFFFGTTIGILWCTMPAWLLECGRVPHVSMAEYVSMFHRLNILASGLKL